MKTFEVSGFFPNAVAHRAYQCVTVKASSIEAAARGLRELHKRDGIRGRRITTMRLEITLVKNKADDSANGTETRKP